MIRGTTAQFQFKLPYPKENIAIAKVTFWQSDNSGLNSQYPLPHEEGYVQSDTGETIYPWNWIDDYTLSVRLSAQKTLTFTDKYKARVQLHARTTDGIEFASNQELITVYPIAGNAPLGEEILPSPSEDDLIILDGETIG